MASGYTDFVDPPNDPFDLSRMAGSVDLPIDYDVLSALADPNFGLATTPKASDRAQSAVDGFAGAVTHGLTGIVGTVTDLIGNLGHTATQALEARTQGQSIIDRLVSGYNRTSSTGNAPAQLEAVGANIDNRITVLEGGALTEFILTSSTTIDVSAFKRLDIVLIGSSTPMPPQYSMSGTVPGGTPGGFLRTQVDVSTLTTPTAVMCLVGTGGKDSYFDTNDLTTATSWRFRTNPGVASAANGMDFVPTLSGPGAGGAGNSGAGGSTPLAQGGVGGILPGGSGPGNPGQPGGSAPITDEARAGGAGGGGGSAAFTGNIPYLGGNGGNAGYPGGGPGAPGRNSQGFGNTNPGGNTYFGANANGVIVVRAS